MRGGHLIDVCVHRVDFCHYLHCQKSDRIHGTCSDVAVTFLQPFLASGIPYEQSKRSREGSHF